MPNVNYDFIRIAEGFNPTGHWPGGNSGVTVGMGVDLKSKNREYFEGLSEQLINKLVPFFGKSGKDAKDVASSLVLTEAEAMLVTEHTKEKELRPLKRKFERDSGIPFDSLPSNIATPIASVAFQYGISNPEERYGKFWEYSTNIDVPAMETELRNFRDNVPAINVRHEAFADFLVGEQKSENVRRLRPDFIPAINSKMEKQKEGTQAGIVPISASGPEYVELVSPPREPELASDLIDLSQAVPKENPMRNKDEGPTGQRTFDDVLRDLNVEVRRLGGRI